LGKAHFGLCIGTFHDRLPSEPVAQPPLRQPRRRPDRESKQGGFGRWTHSSQGRQEEADRVDFPRPDFRIPVSRLVAHVRPLSSALLDQPDVPAGCLDCRHNARWARLMSARNRGFSTATEAYFPGGRDHASAAKRRAVAVVAWLAIGRGDGSCRIGSGFCRVGANRRWPPDRPSRPVR
jgi:hypothetical protein